MAGDGDVLGGEGGAARAGDEFEEILPSYQPEPEPAYGDEFEHILPSTNAASPEGAAALAREASQELTAAGAALQVQRAQANALYARKVEEKRRARGQAQGEFSRQAERSMAVVQATHALSSHGTSATVLHEAQFETDQAAKANTMKKTVSDRRYASKVAQKRRARGLTEGAFSRTAHQRARQRRYCGFTRAQFLRMLGAITLPVLDGISDWVVTAQYAMAHEYGFLAMSIGIQLFMGMVLGWMLAEELEERSERRAGKLPPCSALWGALIGMSGVSSAVQTVVNLRDKAARVPHPRAEIRERSFKSAVALMALPQSVLQAFIGISYSRFEFSSDDFDPVLICSVVISVIGSGVNAVAAERLFRNEELQYDAQLTVSSTGLYIALTAILRTVQTIALVGWVSLLCCSLHYLAVFPGIVALVYYVEMLKECEGQRRSVWPPIAWGVGFALMLALFSLLFFKSIPQDNNYLNQTLEPGPADSAQHLNCQTRTTTHSAIYVCSWLTVPLLVVSLTVDPQHGWKLWHELEKAWTTSRKEERYLSIDEFSSPFFYARYMHTVCLVGMRVRALRTVGSTVTGIGQIPIGDEGVITRTYRNTCVCNWKHQCYSSGRRWIEWQYIEILTPYPTSRSIPDLLQGDFVAGSTSYLEDARATGAAEIAARTHPKPELRAHELATGTASAFLRIMQKHETASKWDPLSGERYDSSVHQAVTALASPVPPLPRSSQLKDASDGDGGGDEVPVDRDSHELNPE